MPLPSPSTSNRPASSQRLPNAARAPTAASQARSGTPKSQQSSNAAPAKSSKIKGSSDRDSIGPTSNPAARRGSTAALLGRDKPPSKDGTVQRTAKEVEGLKDFVRAYRFLLMHVSSTRSSLTFFSNLETAWAVELSAASTVRSTGVPGNSLPSNRYASPTYQKPS